MRGETTDGVTNWLYEVDPSKPYDYIEYAFEEARKVDPDAKLYYNDYGLEYPSPKWDAVLAMVTDFKERGRAD